MTPRYGLFISFSLTTQKKSGVSGLCLSALWGRRKPCKWTEQSDTHAVGIYNTPLKVCVMTFYSHRHTNGNGYIPTRSIYLCIVFDLQFLNFLRSRKPKTSVSKRILICSAPPSDLHRSISLTRSTATAWGGCGCKGTKFSRIRMLKTHLFAFSPY